MTPKKMKTFFVLIFYVNSKVLIRLLPYLTYTCKICSHILYVNSKGSSQIASIFDMYMYIDVNQDGPSFCCISM